MGVKRDLKGASPQSISTPPESGDETTALTLCASQTWLFVNESQISHLIEFGPKK